MKRFLTIPGIALIALSAAAAARADEGSTGPRAAWGHGLRHMEQCLASMDLPASVKSNIDASLSSGRATLKADGQSLKTLHAQMQTDLANGADKSLLGQDAINLDAARQKMKTDARSLHDELLSQLSPDQQDALRACASSHGRQGSGPSSGTGSETPQD